MSQKKVKNLKLDRYIAFHEQLDRFVPQVFSRVSDEEGFRELRVYLRNENEYMGVLKGYDGEGAPIICFGLGTGVVDCLLAIEGAVHADRWREDRPREEK